MKRKMWVMGMLLWGAVLLWLLAACRQKPTVEPGFIRYEIDRSPYQIINRSPYTIELLRYPVSYILEDKAGWSPLIPLTSICVDIPDYEEEGVIPSGAEWNAWWEGHILCPEPEEACDYFEAWRYRVPSQPGRVFVIYSNEGRAADPANARATKLSLSLSSDNPFHFTIHNSLDESLWLCWRQGTTCMWDWSSRLERQTEHGTWEILSHTLDCESDVSHRLEIPPGQSVAVDGTVAYPDYARLPPGVYRWVIALDRFTYYLIFSPQFEWGNAGGPEG
jgi:hypothetical protein